MPRSNFPPLTCKLLRGITALVAAALLGACALVHPSVERVPYVEKTDETTLDEALARADKLDQAFLTRINQLEIYDLGTGLGAFAAGIAGVAFGLFDGGSTSILASGLGGATFLGGRSFISHEERRRIYNNGRMAIACAVDTIVRGLPTIEEPRQEDGIKKTSKRFQTRPKSESYASQLKNIASNLNAPISSPLVITRHSGQTSKRLPEAAVTLESIRRDRDRAGSAALRLAAVVDKLEAADNKGRDLIGHLKLIELRVNDQVTARNFDASSALAVVRKQIADDNSKTKADVDSAKKTAEEVRKGTVASDTAVGKQDESKDDVTRAAEETTVEVNKLDEISDQIQRTLDLPKACLGSLAEAS
jgi:hypothetical protein